MATTGLPQLLLRWRPPAAVKFGHSCSAVLAATFHRLLDSCGRLLVFLVAANERPGRQFIDVIFLGQLPWPPPFVGQYGRH